MIKEVGLTCIPTYVPTYGDGIVLGILIAILAIAAMIAFMMVAEKRMIRESIFNPEQFKLRQDKYNRKLMDESP
jgi:flagellar basal body-associated protein FliL